MRGKEVPIYCVLDFYRVRDGVGNSLNAAFSKKEKEQVYKPNPVSRLIVGTTTIYLVPILLSGSNDLPILTPKWNKSGSLLNQDLFGLSPHRDCLVSLPPTFPSRSIVTVALILPNIMSEDGR